jgi:integral membrane sensor domain MASE1
LGWFPEEVSAGTLAVVGKHIWPGSPLLAFSFLDISVGEEF